MCPNLEKAVKKKSHFFKIAEDKTFIEIRYKNFSTFNFTIKTLMSYRDDYAYLRYQF